MDTKSKLLSFCFVIMVISSIVVTFYKTILLEEITIVDTLENKDDSLLSE